MSLRKQKTDKQLMREYLLSHAVNAPSPPSQFLFLADVELTRSEVRSICQEHIARHAANYQAFAADQNQKSAWEAAGGRDAIIQVRDRIMKLRSVSLQYAHVTRQLSAVLHIYKTAFMRYEELYNEDTYTSQGGCHALGQLQLAFYTYTQKKRKGGGKE